MAENCRSCGAPIFWGKTTSGKAVPLNPKPLTGYMLLNADQNIYSVERFYETHFSNCPNAAAHRKKPDETAPSDLRMDV